MSKPRISDHRRRIWRKYPLARAGVSFDQADQRAIAALLEAGDTFGAQRMILDKLTREIDGPRTVARWRGGRKVLHAV